MRGEIFHRIVHADDDTSVIITESTARSLGYYVVSDIHRAVGKRDSAVWQLHNAIVIGIVNDYHQVSLKKAIDPVDFYFLAISEENYIRVRVDSKNISQTLAACR